MHMYTCICIWKPEIDIKNLPQPFPSNLLRQDLSLNLEFALGILSPPSKYQDYKWVTPPWAKISSSTQDFSCWSHCPLGPGAPLSPSILLMLILNLDFKFLRSADMATANLPSGCGTRRKRAPYKPSIPLKPRVSFCCVKQQARILSTQTLPSALNKERRVRTVAVYELWLCMYYGRPGGQLQDRVPSCFTLACMCVSVCACVLYVCVHVYVCVSACAFVSRSCGGQQPMSDVFLYHSLLSFFQAVIHQTCSPLILQDQLPRELQTAPVSAFTVLELQGCTFQLGAGDQNSGPHACRLSTLSLKHLPSPLLFLFVVRFKFVSNSFEFHFSKSGLFGFFFLLCQRETKFLS